MAKNTALFDIAIVGDSRGESVAELLRQRGFQVQLCTPQQLGQRARGTLAAILVFGQVSLLRDPAETTQWIHFSDDAETSPINLTRLVEQDSWVLPWPIQEELLLRVVTKACVLGELKREHEVLKGALGSVALAPEIVCESPAMRELWARVLRVAELDAPVLLTGESGTGKTTVARLIHSRGPRCDEPFISVSCAAIPRDLLEAELFGYERGAFTGAVRSHPGSVGLADEGTLFLDEIGDLPLELQPKLLTFLQDGRYRPLGALGERAAEVRVIAATNRDLRAMVSRGEFREDLYFRIDVLHLKIPSLRERPEDIPALVDRIVARIAARPQGQTLTLTPGARQALQSYDWPGNVRELENVLERASAFHGDAPLEAKDLVLRGQAEAAGNAAVSLVGRTLRDIEVQAVRDTLVHCNGDKVSAARMLGVSLKGLYNKLKRYEIG